MSIGGGAAVVTGGATVASGGAAVVTGGAAVVAGGTDVGSTATVVGGDDGASFGFVVGVAVECGLVVAVVLRPRRREGLPAAGSSEVVDSSVAELSSA